MPTNRVPTLAEVINNAVRSHLGDTYHILPGYVVQYYPATQDADVQIAINDPRFDPDTDELTTEKWPICPHVRVVWPRFAGLTIIGPLNPNSPVQCFFQDLDDSVFRSNGQVGDPNRTLRHGSDSMFCVPWDITDKGIATDAVAAQNNNCLIIGADGTQAEIRINGGVTPIIQLGATGGDFVALASKVMTELGKIQSAFSGHHHTVPITGPIGTTPTSNASSYSPANVASTLIKAQ